MSKDKKKTQADPNTPKCPICGRRSTVRKIDAITHYCDHCKEAFARQ